MTLYELMKTRGTGKGEDAMWKSISAISDAVETYLDETSKNELLSEIYGIMSGGHYDENYAVACVSKMYYRDENGNKHSAPYWSEPQVRAVYEKVAKRIPGAYTFWDFYVTLNMIASDNWPVIQKWFPGADEQAKTEKAVDLAVAWLDDPDNPYGDSKTWDYLHAK